MIVSGNENGVEWIEKLSSHRAELEEEGKRLGIHPLALEDCFHSNQRAKYDDFEMHQLLVWFLIYEDRTYELEFVIYPRSLLLVTMEPAPEGKSWHEFLRLTANPKDSHHLLHQALDHAMDITTEQIRPVFRAIDEFEQHLFAEAADPRALLGLKRQLSRYEFALAPLSSVVDQLYRSLQPKDDLKWRLRDLMDHSVRTHQRLLFSLNQVASAMEMYWGFTSKRTNDRIKKLSLLASVAIPLSFWCSFWGMNFTTIPFHDARLFLFAMVVMAASGIAIYWALKRRGYWEKD